jgi:hypothetical protein
MPFPLLPENDGASRFPLVFAALAECRRKTRLTNDNKVYEIIRNGAKIENT